MRSVAVLGVLAGCNQIYGLDPTKVIDAAPPPRRVSLTYMISTDAPDMHALDFDTAVRDVRELSASTLDGAQTLDLLPSYGDTGTVEVPELLAGQPWRLAYKIAEDVPYEVQNASGDLHLVVPMFGPLDRVPVPVQSGYSVTPMSFLANGGNHATHRVFTTGIWTEGFVIPSPPPTEPKLDYLFGNATSLFGPLGAPNAKDLVLVADYTSADCGGMQTGLVSIGAVFVQLALAKNTLTAPMTQPIWDNGTKNISLLMDQLTVLNQAALVAKFAPDDPKGTISIGITPSDRMPAFEAAPRLTRLLPGPVLAFDLQCPWARDTVPNLPDYHESPAASDFTAVLHVEITSTRVVSGVSLVSGMAVVTPDVGGENAPAYAPVFAAPAVTGATLMGPLGPPVDLFKTNKEGVQVTDRSGALRLSFELDGGSTDYVEVTLHQLDAMALKPVRRYTVFGTSVEIDPALLANGEYVFEIRTFTGRPGALVGDFRVATLPQSMTTMFTRTFITR